MQVGRAEEIGPGIRRLLAPNAGPMTGPGTNTYLLGDTDVAVIDPGPRDTDHIEAIQVAVEGRIKWILVTHTHPDHSPAAIELAKATGAQLLGMAAPDGKHQDRTFVADRPLSDGEFLDTKEFCLRCVHTPGHASNHICYRHEALAWLFTGDHIMNGSTVVIDPPDGDMYDYFSSLRLLKTLQLSALAPGHGPVIENPNETVDALLDHRTRREEKITTALQARGNSTVGELVADVYADVDVGLHRLAERSLLAHLLKLEKEARAKQIKDRWSSTFEGRKTPA